VRGKGIEISFQATANDWPLTAMEPIPPADPQSSTGWRRSAIIDRPSRTAIREWNTEAPAGAAKNMG
jgi:hypothetical protein